MNIIDKIKNSMSLGNNINDSIVNNTEGVNTGTASIEGVSTGAGNTEAVGSGTVGSGTVGSGTVGIGVVNTEGAVNTEGTNIGAVGTVVVNTEEASAGAATTEGVGVGAEDDIKKIEKFFEGKDSRKLKLALLVVNSKGWESIKDQVEALSYTQTHSWEMRNELGNILGRPLPCVNC